MWQMIWVGATSARRSAMALGGVSGFLAERFWPLQNSPHVVTVYRCDTIHVPASAMTVAGGPVAKTEP
jgi:hypothetical protein